MLPNQCSKVFARSFSGTPVLFAKYSRESRFMSKIMSRNTIKKHYKVVNVATPTLFPEKNAKVINKRRVAVLNKLFMKNITDILSTGNIDPLLMDLGLEISKVAITPDFLHLNVFWYTQIWNNEENIEHRLLTAAPKIHHELSQLKLMGFIPKICFIKDRKRNQIEELEHLFQTLSLSKREGTDETDEDDVISDEPQYTNLPSMTSNIYGLDHEMIMKKVVVNIGKRINKLKTDDKQDQFSPDNRDAEENKI
ncbi:unnamed protein product [Nezara viridula]|uniref:Ribosome-binding factor A, mitochondrial n=1 Tax=Nezara viridula TaxID=85310 RepID=A0A9P0EBE8_NEZVI|nr:unnamed protein product [Nezara viridula]